MPKQKTHKGLAKRVKVTAGRKVKHRRAGASHLMSVKTPHTRRKLRRPTTIASKRVVKKLIASIGG